jgi:hypothetical protein
MRRLVLLVVVSVALLTTLVSVAGATPGTPIRPEITAVSKRR